MQNTEPHRKSILREYLEALLIAVVFVNFARVFVFQAFKIPTGSMIDNLLVGDHIIVNKFVYGAHGTRLGVFPFRSIHRSDIIVFRYPGDPETDFVKRVVGMPGDTVAIRDKKVFIDGKLLPEPYAVHEDPQVYPLQPALPEPYRSRDQFGPFTVPPEHYFVMGDNRDRSNDSRYWGTVPRSLIKGKALLVYWSFRGAPPLPGSPASERLKELLSVAANFFSNTRWDRTFMIVDSKYHYHPEPADGMQP